MHEADFRRVVDAIAAHCEYRALAHGWPGRRSALCAGWAFSTLAEELRQLRGLDGIPTMNLPTETRAYGSQRAGRERRYA